MKRNLLFSAALTALLLGACENKPATETTTPAATTATAEDHAQHQHASPTTDSTSMSQTAGAVYECPMGCKGSTSSKPGKCPVCEMALVKKG